MSRIIGAALLTFTLVACSKGGDTAKAPAASKPAATKKAPAAKKAPEAKKATAVPKAAGAGAAAEAKQLFETRCAACHGKSGKGDGLAAANLPVKPRNYHDAAWQASVKDDYLMKIIVEGGAAVGKSPLMAASPDLKAKPEVVKELVKIVRSFKK